MKLPRKYLWILPLVAICFLWRFALEIYDGPLTLSKDMLVWNVTKEKIGVREVVYNENVWTAPITEKGEIDTSLRESESDFIKKGAADFSDVIGEVYERTNKKYGTDVKPEVTK